MHIYSNQVQMLVAANNTEVIRLQAEVDKLNAELEETRALLRGEWLKTKKAIQCYAENGKTQRLVGRKVKIVFIDDGLAFYDIHDCLHIVRCEIKLYENGYLQLSGIPEIGELGLCVDNWENFLKQDCLSIANY